MSGFRPTKVIIISGLLALAAVLFARNQLASWACDRLFSPRPANPISAPEYGHLAEWRTNGGHAPGEMVSSPFRLVTPETTGAVASISIANDSPRAVRDVWFYRADMPNFYSAQTIVDSVTAAKLTETDKVMALFDLFCRYYYNYWPLPTPGLLAQPSPVLAVLGTAQCNYAASALATLCGLVGCPTRLVGVEYDGCRPAIAHCTMEVFADGRWIFMDPDGHRVYRRADGGWASAADLRRDAAPVRRAGHAYYAAAYADAFEKGTIRYYGFEPGHDPSDRFRLGAWQEHGNHHMRFDLLPGTTVELYPGRRGAFFGFEVPDYSSGVQEWRAQPRFFNGTLPDGILGENITATRNGGDIILRRVHRDRPAALVIPMRTPYLMTAGHVMADVTSRSPVRVYVLPAQVDPVHGDGWTCVGDLAEAPMLDFNATLADAPTSCFLVKIAVPRGGVTVHRLQVAVFLQCATQALPHLAPGINDFRLYAQAPVVARASTMAGNEASVRFDNGLRIAFTVDMPRSRP